MNYNYIEIIRWYWDEVPQMEGFKSDYNSLFFALLDSINRNGWSATPIEYDRIIYKTRMGKRMYHEARKWLDKNQIISVVEGRGDYAKAQFSIGDAVQKCTSKRTAHCTSPAPHTTPHTAPINNKPNKPNKPLNNEKENIKKENNSVLGSEEKEVPSFVEVDRQRAREAAKNTGSSIVPVSELGEQLKIDVATCELFGINNRITVTQVRAAIDIFTGYVAMKGEDYTRVRFRSHFTNWLPLNLDKLVPKKVENKMVY